MRVNSTLRPKGPVSSWFSESGLNALGVIFGWFQFHPDKIYDSLPEGVTGLNSFQYMALYYLTCLFLCH